PVGPDGEARASRAARRPGAGERPGGGRDRGASLAASGEVLPMHPIPAHGPASAGPRPLAKRAP
ncbi:MAG: hypothetical protein OXF79_20180, partial [Chloroflexi bacterium]|nr:hypothetical protein [Chloroflexota bacterium]